MEPKRLYRNTQDKKIGGVCSGLAEYFDIDTLLVRLIFVVLALAGGGGVLIYLVFWIIMPDKPVGFTQPLNNPVAGDQHEHQEKTETSWENPPKETPVKPEVTDQRSKGSLIGALVLITLGVLFLADEFIPHISFGDFWPVILIVIGVGLLLNSMRKRNS